MPANRAVGKPIFSDRDFQVAHGTPGGQANARERLLVERTLAKLDVGRVYDRFVPRRVNCYPAGLADIYFGPCVVIEGTFAHCDTCAELRREPDRAA